MGLHVKCTAFCTIYLVRGKHPTSFDTTNEKYARSHVALCRGTEASLGFKSCLVIYCTKVVHAVTVEFLLRFVQGVTLFSSSRCSGFPPVKPEYNQFSAQKKLA